MADEKKMTAREQIEALQQEMLADQLKLLEDFAKFWDNVEVRTVVGKLREFKARAIPNSAIDQQLNSLIVQLEGAAMLPVHTRSSIEAQLNKEAARGPAGT